MRIIKLGLTCSTTSVAIAMFDTETGEMCLEVMTRVQGYQNRPRIEAKRSQRRKLVPSPHSADLRTLR